MSDPEFAVLFSASDPDGLSHLNRLYKATSDRNIPSQYGPINLAAKFPSSENPLAVSTTILVSSLGAIGQSGRPAAL